MPFIVDFMCESPNAPRRPAWPDALRSRVLARQGNRFGPGRCWHCGITLTGQQWDVDHHPIPYRHIFDQLCCGVTDPLDESNLVPSCPSCNRSHRHEASNKSYFCGRSQCCCLRSVCRRATYLLLGCVLVGVTWMMVSLAQSA